MTGFSQQLKRSVIVPVLFGALVTGGGVPVSGDPPVGQEVTPAEASQDPDLPGFLEGRIDKEQYLLLRHGALDEYRGLPYAPGKGAPANPRAVAIKSMEAQQKRQLDLRALTPGGLPPPNWESVGPAPIPNGQTSTRSDPVSGRTTAITVDPTDANVAYVGTAQGGVYRTLDGGASWTAIFDTAQSLAIGAIAIAPSDPSIVYVGTGESHNSGDSFFGVGVYRINNAKTTADLTGPINPNQTFNGSVVTGAFTGRAISEILVHPTDPATIFVSTFTGIAGLGATALEGPAAVPPLGVLGVYRSTNATTASPTFQKLSLGLPAGTRLFAADPLSENSRVTDLIFEPSEPNNLLAAVYGGPPQGGAFSEGGVYRTTNALAATPTFTRPLPIATNAIRIEFAINKVGSTVTVVAATGESASGTGCPTGSGAVRKSTDGGATWSAKLAGGGGFCGNQCSYDIAVAIDPNDANLVYLGGAANGTCSRVYVRSTDGGSSFAFSDDGLHADTHALTVAPSNPNIVYVGNDGGIWRSTDAAQTWTSLNNTGFNATQFQSLSLHPIDREFMIGGTQDNGTQFKRPDASWFRADFGDGGFALIDQSATDTENVTMYHTYFNQANAMGYGRVTKASDAFEGNWEFFGCGFVAGTNGLNCSPPASSILFYAPIALGPGTPNTLYFGSDRLFRSTDRGETMVLASQGPIQSTVAISAIGISPQDDNIRLVGMRFGKVWATHNGSSTLVDVTGLWPQSANLAAQPRRFVSRVVIDPNDNDVAYVTFATYCAGAANCAQVYKTTDLVTALTAVAFPTWTAANTGLPDVPVNAFVVDPRDSSRLFAGTDIGVYQSIDAGASWLPYGTGFPRVTVFDMALHAPSGTLRVATHGRGIWEIAAGNATPSFTSLSSPTIGLGGGPTILSGFLKAGSLVPPGSVDVTVNSITQSAPITPGTGFFSTSFLTDGLAANVYPITYSFVGAPGYEPAAEVGTLTVSASLAPTTTTISAPDAAYPNGSVTVTVTSGAGTPAGDVTLQVDGGAVLTQTLAAGTAVFALPTAGVGTHDLLASFAAQGSFGASSATGALTITQGTPSFTLKSPAIHVGQTPSFLTGTLAAGGAIPSGTVDITLDGVTHTAAIDPTTGAFSSSFVTGALAAGTYPIGVTYAGDANLEAVTGSASLNVTPVYTTSTFANPGLILVPPTLDTPGPGSPSPSVISVVGLTGPVLKASVVLRGVTHSFASDMEFLLVAPDGSTTVLMSRVGGDVGVAGVDLTFDDAGADVPSPLATGTYRPSQSGVVVDFLTGGAPGPDPPAAPYGTNLFVHNGGAPNGAWKLYAQDQLDFDFGEVAGGWDLVLVTSPPAEIFIDDVSVAEGGDAVFTVSLSSPSPIGVSVDYQTASGAALSGVDFTAASGSVFFEPLVVSKTVQVTTLADGIGEGDEDFVVDLSNPEGATIADAQGVGTITDVDPNATIGDVQKAEGNAGRTSFLFVVTLDAPPAAPVSVRFATESLGATPGRDYTHTSGILSFAAGQTSRSISVAVVGDRVEERDEFFKVVLSSPTGGLVLDTTEALGWIVNDDFVGPPKVSISDATLGEGDAGSANMLFTVRLSRVSNSVLTVPYATANGTATAGSDYTAGSGLVTFPVGVTERTISVAITGDVDDEADETFFVNLGAARGVAYLDRQGKGTIVDDDP